MRTPRQIVTTLILCLCAITNAPAKTVVMSSPEEYQILSVSPNGNWACGVYVDYGYSIWAFRWNLESGNIELLSSEKESQASSIADDGTVMGFYTATDVLPDEVPLEIPAFYKDGAWHTVALPEGNITGGSGWGGITADGKYMAASVEVDGIFQGYIWDVEENKIVRYIDSNGLDCMLYAISPDGKSATGWAYTNQGKQRTAVYYPYDSEAVILSDFKSPWSAGKAFSNNGKKLVYFGGFDKSKGTCDLIGVYDIATGSSTSIPYPDDSCDADVFGVSDNGTTVGQAYGQAYICSGGESQPLYNYLIERGADLSSLNIMESGGTPLVTHGLCISGDENIIGVFYVDNEGNQRSCVVKFDVNEDNLPPANIEAKKLEGVNTVKITWTKHVNAENVQGYNVYRNGTKVNDQIITTYSFFDKNLSIGTYTYNVAAVQADGSEAMGKEVVVNVEPFTVSMPQAVFARQNSVKGAHVIWEKPKSNFITKGFINTNVKDAFGASSDDFRFEVAIRFDKDDMANYEGCKLKRVDFYPMAAAESWKLNLYTRDSSGALCCIHSQDIVQALDYGKKNTVTLDNAIDIPDNELIVGIEVYIKKASNVIGMDFTKAEAGYSDLMRQAGEDDFQIMAEASQAAGYSFNLMWQIDAVLVPQGADENADNLKNYIVMADGKDIATVDSNSAEVTDLAIGSHTLGVKAMFENGECSAAETATLNIEDRYKPIENVKINMEGETTVHAAWENPMDNDETVMSYASGEPQARSIYLQSGNGNELMAAVDFSTSKMKGLEGYYVKSFKFYPLTDALYTFILKENDVEVAEIEVDDYKTNQWNEIVLTEPVIIKDASAYRLILDCYDVPTNEYVLAIDKNIPFEGVSDLYSFTGGSFISFGADSGLSGNWMLGMSLENPNGGAIDVSGYDVSIDGVKRNDSKLTAPEFTYTFDVADKKQHSINVDVYYAAKSGVMKGNTSYFYLDAGAGIGENMVAEIKLQTGGNMLKVEGEGVESISVFASNGIKVASADGDVISVNGLAVGSYLVKIVAGGKVIVRKIHMTMAD